jgi:hypothetical protein
VIGDDDWRGKCDVDPQARFAKRPLFIAAGHDIGHSKVILAQFPIREKMLRISGVNLAFPFCSLLPRILLVEAMEERIDVENTFTCDSRLARA